MRKDYEASNAHALRRDAGTNFESSTRHSATVGSNVTFANAQVDEVITILDAVLGA